jgi:hypothetical protein
MKSKHWIDSVAAVASVVFLGYSGYAAAGCGGQSSYHSASSSSDSRAGHPADGQPSRGQLLVGLDASRAERPKPDD